MSAAIRALCAELIKKIDYTWGDIPSDVLDLMNRARALVAQPEPEGLTDEEIMELMPQNVRDDLKTAASCMVANWAKAAGACRVVLNAGAVKHCRAAIAADRARYGRPAVAAVAPSERPWEREGWCDAEGLCWVGHLGFREKVEETGEFFTMPDEWQLEKPELNPIFPCVLLPHWAIPLPTTPQEPQS